MENKILATVGGMAITSDEVDEFIMAMGQRGQGYNSTEGRKIVLDQLVSSKLLLLDARRNLIEAEAEFKARLAKVKENLLVNYVAEKTIAQATPATEAEAKTYYEEHPEQFKRGESVSASHILVDTEESAINILADIKAGKISFEDAAKTYSSCPSKENGGSLGEFTRGQMVPEFDKAVFEMSVGEISEAPVKTQFGYHLIMLTDKKESQPVAFDEVKEGIKNMLTEDKKHRALDSKINQLKILYPVDYAL